MMLVCWQISIHLVGFCIFCGQLVVAVIMIDGNKTCKLLVIVEVQSPYVVERRINTGAVFLVTK